MQDQNKIYLSHPKKLSVIIQIKPILARAVQLTVQCQVRLGQLV